MEYIGIKMETVIHKKVELARNNSNPNVIHRMKSGWAVLGDVQFLEGYCLLLPDPVVPTLNDLTGIARTQFLSDMALLGDVLLEVTGATRINYEMLGNVEVALHAHLFPRQANEPSDLIKRPVWFYDWNAAPKFDLEKHAGLMGKIRAGLQARGV